MSAPPSLGDKPLKESRLRRWSLVTLRVLFATAVAFLFTELNLDYLESFFYDLRVRAIATPPTSGHIHLVLFDKKSVSQLKSDLRPAVLEKLVEKIAAAEPRYLVLNVDLEDMKGSAEEKASLARTLEKFPSLAVTTDALALAGDKAGLHLAPPYEKVRVVSAPRTSDSKIYAKDGVTRRMVVSYENQELFHYEAALSYNPELPAPEELPGSFDFAGSIQAYIKFHPAGTYPVKSATDVLNTVDLSAYQDKIVILGSDTEQRNQDYILTPYSREVMAMSTAEMHANMFDTLMLEAAPRVSPKWFDFLVTWFIAILTVHIVLSMRPTHGLAILSGTVVGFVLICYLAFWIGNFWIAMAAPLLTIFLCYYFFIPYRLIIENRRSWEYYQKNRLLSQVEELKTNFISMMSHDLKTPIARVQGMTSVILADPTPLSSVQREAVDTIRQSADDLLKFITSILNYGRIESEGVQLNVESRDINNLLVEVIRKHEFLAKVKRIQIITELEPLFPVPVDPDLMKQVFSNLIENAIKYSPEETRILVCSEENSSKSKIVIQVSDQGPGIAPDELQNIFMKFFRSKNVKSSPIKGSGLGLYLAKYFTELHRGKIFVESTLGNGSTFTVELPVEQGSLHA